MFCLFWTRLTRLGYFNPLGFCQTAAAGSVLHMEGRGAPVILHPPQKSCSAVTAALSAGIKTQTASMTSIPPEGCFNSFSSFQCQTVAEPCCRVWGLEPVLCRLDFLGLGIRLFWNGAVFPLPLLGRDRESAWKRLDWDAAIWVFSPLVPVPQLFCQRLHIVCTGVMCRFASSSVEVRPEL